MNKKRVGVALLGMGVVGGGVYKIIEAKREDILKRDGVEIDVVYVLDRNDGKLDALGVPKEKRAKDIDEIIRSKKVDIVAEFFGGVEPARTYLTEALKAGKSVVSANKEMLAKSFFDLEAARRIGGGGIYFEASCMGGVPIIRTLTDAMQANTVSEIKGIVNGTTNYILSRMSESGASFDECLKEAQILGYAEADPKNDVDGFDALFKTSILSSLAFSARVPCDRILREGIRNVSPEDIALAKELGYAIKLLAIAKNGEHIEARVQPTLIPLSNPLARVDGVFNAALITGDNVGDIMLFGRGAGAFPTGSAIVSDIVFAARCEEPREYAFMCEKEDGSKFSDDFVSGYFLRIKLASQGDGADRIIAALKKQGIKADKILKKNDGTLAIVTLPARKSKLAAALNVIAQLGEVKSVESAIAAEE